MTSARLTPAQPPSSRKAITSRRAFVLVAVAGLVHIAGRTCALAQRRRGREVASKGGADQRAADVITGQGPDLLPPAVAEMRAAILTAVETGDIAELKGAMDLNELKPELGGRAGDDPIAHLRSLSADGTGKDILEMIGRLLDGTWAAIPGGRDLENNRIYVWPHFAEVPFLALGPADLMALEALVGEKEAAMIRAAGRWTGWRLSIGADGVWHMLTHVK